MNRMLGVALLTVVACGKEPPAKSAPPATVEHGVAEAQLTTITLSAEAFERLGIRVTPAESGGGAATRMVGGEVMSPPGQALSISAPAAGTVLAPENGTLPLAGRRVAAGEPLLRLLALPPNQAAVREAFAVSRARLTEAEAEAKRVADLYGERLVAARDQERAQANLAAARAAFETATAQVAQVERGTGTGGLAPLLIAAPASGVVRMVAVGVGQAVAAGALLLEVVGVDRLWVRVPLFAGDARAVARGRAAVVSPLGGGSTSVMAQPVVGPPMADPGAASVDLFYELRASAANFRPGERVNIAIPLAGRDVGSAVVVPTAALVLDAYGGTWVYQRIDSLKFARRRVEVLRVVEDRAFLSRGLAVGSNVVVAGAAELFGTEFGAGK